MEQKKLLNIVLFITTSGYLLAEIYSRPFLLFDIVSYKIKHKRFHVNSNKIEGLAVIFAFFGMTIILV